jgi:hypothetical protein
VEARLKMEGDGVPKKEFLTNINTLNERKCP